MSNFKDYKWYRIWIKLNNGWFSTHVDKFLSFHTDMEYTVDSWCSQFRPFYPDDCTYGYKEMDAPPREVLIQKISVLEHRIEKDQALLAEYTNQVPVQDYQHGRPSFCPCVLVDIPYKCSNCGRESKGSTC